MSRKKEDPQLKSARNLIIGLLLFMIVGIGAFYGYKSYKDSQVADERFTYNYFKVEKRDGIWWTEAQQGKNLFLITMRYSPREVENVTVIGDVQELRRKWGFFYITFDPTEEKFADVTMANAEISTKLVQHFGIGVAPGCIKPAPECTQLNVTLVSCENESLPVIFLNQESPPVVKVQGNCIIVQGEESDIIRAADRLMYNLYGIMK
ncbi:MAG: hypothetical protein QXK37_03085 [Candidatus Woesearchaeota archaeon]